MTLPESVQFNGKLLFTANREMRPCRAGRLEWRRHLPPVRSMPKSTRDTIAEHRHAAWFNTVHI